MSKETGLVIPSPQLEIARKLNENVFQVIGKHDVLVGFEKAYQIANATQAIKELLTPQYMKPIMALQGNRLGFKTDKDDKGGYSEDVVKNCLIEAVLTGVQPHGNQFNIIAGNMYVTKEGFGELLKQISGLKYDIIFDLPRINPEKTSAAVNAKISWTYQGEKQEKDIPIPVKMNQYMGTDAVIGKATRKARAWLFNTITGAEIGDGDVTDIDSRVVSSKPLPIDKETERIALMIHEAETLKDLKALEKHVPDELLDLFNNRAVELAEKK